MGTFTLVSQDTFEALQLDAGVLLSTFDPAHPVRPDDEDILCTTTGGVQITCQPNYSDFGEDVDNVPNNMMELKHLDGWTCTASFSSIKFNGENFQMALGAADITEVPATTGVDAGSAYTKITPRMSLNQTDFKTIWWVGDKTSGGAVAVKLFNVLSTDGLSIQTTKNEKGTMSMTLTGHVSLSAQNTVPMEFYEIPAPSTNG